jgi:trehalose synthase
VIAASLGFQNLDHITDGDVPAIQQAHLLLAMFNALQPGVFSLSGWDLCGVLTLPREKVQNLLDTGDTRWIHRAGYDLMDYQPQAKASSSGMPVGRALYGALPQQLANPDSFASQLKHVLEVREATGIATATQIEVPAVSHPAVLAMIHQTQDGAPQATVLNFGTNEVSTRVASGLFPPGASVRDALTDTVIGQVDDLQSIEVDLGIHNGVLLVFEDSTSSHSSD